MKNLKVGLLLALAATGLTGCGNKVCEHVDANPKDHKCDLCGEVLSQCADEDKDHKCDYCGETLSECKDEDPKDHKCDYCGETLSECADEDPKDHKCDYCGGTISEHTDVNPKDHNCDICGDPMTTCVDANHDGTCDICGATGMAVHHTDTNEDGFCDSPECGIAIIMESVALDTDKVQKTFAVGDTFNSVGLKVIATMTDETTKELQFTVTPPAMTSAGTKTVTVNFQKNGAADSLTYEITVVNWTNTELSALTNANSLLAVLGQAYPFMVGMTASVDQTTGLITLTKANATVDDVDAYAEKLLATTGTFRIDSGTTGNYGFTNFTSLPEGAAAFAGVDPETALCFVNRLTYKSGSYVFQFDLEEGLYFDEYVVVGLDASNNLVVKTRMVNTAGWSTVIGNPINYRGYAFSKEFIDDINTYLADARNGIGVDFNECAAGVLQLPELAVSEDVEKYPIFPMDLGYLEPFNSDYDQYDFANYIAYMQGTSAERDAYLGALQAAGFTAQTEETGNDPLTGEATTFAVYKYAEKYAGEFTVKVTSYSANYMQEDETTFTPGYGIEFMYKLPNVVYTRGERSQIEEFFSAFGVTTENMRFGANDSITATLAVTEGTTAEGVIDGITTALGTASSSYELTKKNAEANDDGSWTATFQNDVYALQLTVKVNGTVATLTTTLMVATPAGSTAETLSAVLGEALGIEFNADGNGNYVGVYDKYSTSGYAYNYMYSIVVTFVEPELPEYLLADRVPASYDNEGPNGEKSLRFTYITTDGSLQVTVLVYAEVNGATAKGVTAVITVGEPQEITVPDGTTAESMWTDLCNKFGGVSEIGTSTSTDPNTGNTIYSVDDAWGGNLLPISAGYMSAYFNQYILPELEQIMGLLPEYAVVDESTLTYVQDIARPSASIKAYTVDGKIEITLEIYLGDASVFGSQYAGYFTDMFKISFVDLVTE